MPYQRQYLTKLLFLRDAASCLLHTKRMTQVTDESYHIKFNRVHPRYCRYWKCPLNGYMHWLHRVSENMTIYPHFAGFTIKPYDYPLKNNKFDEIFPVHYFYLLEFSPWNHTKLCISSIPTAYSLIWSAGHLIMKWGEVIRNLNLLFLIKITPSNINWWK
jgi:hypothetical protein